jgi:hypothetical protein
MTILTIGPDSLTGIALSGNGGSGNGNGNGNGNGTAGPSLRHSSVTHLPRLLDR